MATLHVVRRPFYVRVAIVFLLLAIALANQNVFTLVPVESWSLTAKIIGLLFITGAVLVGIISSSERNLFYFVAGLLFGLIELVVGALWILGETAQPQEFIVALPALTSAVLLRGYLKGR